MLKCDSSKCRGTLFMTVKGNNSSLPANFTFLRGWRSECQSWIQHLVSHNTPYHHTHDLAPPSIYNSCYKIVIRTFCRIFSLKQAREKSLLWNEVCLWNIFASAYTSLLPQTEMFIHEQGFFFRKPISGIFHWFTRQFTCRVCVRATEASLLVWQEI